MRYRVAALLVVFSLLFLPVRAEEREWESHGPYGGSIWDVFPVGPPGRLLATTPSGTYITEDAGLHWRLLDSNLKLYGVVEQPGNGLWGWDSCRIYRSSDNGATWSAGGADYWWVNKLAVDPVTPSTLYLAAYLSRDEPGLLKSINSGASWTRLPLPDTPQNIVLTPSAILVTVSYSLYRSTDGGNSFSLLSPQASFNPRAIAQDPSDLSRLYCIGSSGLVLTSSNSGLTWQTVGQLATEGGGFPESLAVDPHNAQVLCAWVSGSIYRSENGGAHWERVTAPYQFRDMAFDPNIRGRLWAATAGGVRMSDSAGDWVRRSTGLWNASVRAIAFDPRNPFIVYAGTAHDGLQRSSDAGDTWEELALDPAEVGLINCVGVHPSSAGTIFVGSSKGVFKSTDGGTSWSLSESSPIDVHSIIAKSRRVLAATSSGLYCSRNDGETWQTTGFNPDPVRVIDAGRGSIYLSYKGEIWRSINSGLTWKRIAQTDSGLAIFAADPVRPWIVYAATWCQVWKSSDSGRTWKSFGQGVCGSWNNEMIWSLALLPSSPRSLIVAVNDSPYPPSPGPWPPRSGSLRQLAHGTDDWQPFLPERPTSDLLTFVAVSPDGRFLYAGSEENGLLRLEF